jgi:hypothetical protein
MDSASGRKGLIMRAANNPDELNKLRRPALILRASFFLLPVVVLLVARARNREQGQLLLGLGCVFQLVLGSMLLYLERRLRRPASAQAIILYLFGLGWLWLGTAQKQDWFLHLAQAVLLLVPLAVFALQTLADSGAPALRHAQLLAQRLATRRDWPADLWDCRELPEVKAFREALHPIDAAPALNLLGHARPAVRVAALAALEFRRDWRPGQVDCVQQLAQQSSEPAVRGAVICALANVDDRLLVETLAEFLLDDSGQVRQVALEALLWKLPERWTWIRQAVRRSLAHPDFENDGPLHCESRQFPAEAVADLKAWAAQKGVLAMRAAQTLGGHYRAVLNDQPDEALIQELRRQLADPQAPPALRLELARLLHAHEEWDDSLLDDLLRPINPASLRLWAAEILMAGGASRQALATLYDVARLPNREIALATAEVVQRCLNVDLGLPVGQPLPALSSREAAEITRRVIFWAAHSDQCSAHSVAE